MAKLLVVALAAFASVSMAVLGMAQEMENVGVGTPVAWTVDGTPVHTVNTVAIVDDPVEFFAFMPKDVTIPVGGTVVWENRSTAGEGHTVDSKDESAEVFVSSPPDSAVSLKNGDSFSHTFETAGTFPYECGIHTDMMGTVIVTE